MQFGLCNALATFMRLMNDVLFPFIYSFFIFYLDYIHIYSATWEEHISNVREVLEIEEAPVASKSQEVQLCATILGVFVIGDWWRRIEDRSFQDGGLHDGLVYST